MNATFFNKLLTIFAGVVLFLIVGTIFYNEAIISEVTMIVQLRSNEDPLVAIKSACEGQCAVRSIHEVDKKENKYEVRVATKKTLPGLLDWFRNNSQIKKVEIKS